MKKDLMNVLCGDLKEHTNLVARGISSAHALDLINLAKDIMPSESTLVSRYQEQLITMSIQVCDDITRLFNSATPNQLEAFVDTFSHKELDCPVYGLYTMRIGGVTIHRGVWYMEFTEAVMGLDNWEFTPEQLTFRDQLNILEALEDII